MSTKLSYSAEEKRSIVETYLQGKTSQQDLAERYGIGKSTIHNWLRLYQTFGLEGLSRQKHTTRYSPELKLSVVKAYLSGQGSLRELCRRYSIRSDRQLLDWIRKYNEHQESSTISPRPQQRQKGNVLMSKGRKTTSVRSENTASAMSRSTPGYANMNRAVPTRSLTVAARESPSRHGKN